MKVEDDKMTLQDQLLTSSSILFSVPWSGDSPKRTIHTLPAPDLDSRMAREPSANPDLLMWEKRVALASLGQMLSET